MKIVALHDGHLASVECDGLEREVDVSLIDHPAPGDYVIVHAGFAIERIDLAEAERQIAALDELASASRTMETGGAPASAAGPAP